MGNNNNIIINNRRFYKISYRPRNGKTFYEFENYKRVFDSKDNKDLNSDGTLHLVDKHYGLEKDCPLCRAFQMKKLKEAFLFTKLK